MLDDQACAVDVFTNPLHPALADLLQDQSPYYEIQTELTDWIDSLNFANVTVHRFRTPAAFGGLDDDYFDGSHMGRHNGNALLDHILTKR